MPSEYDLIRESLQHNLRDAEHKIQRLKEIQYSGRVATKEDIRILDENMYALSNEEIALMMQAKSDKRQEKGKPSYQPFLITDKNQDNFNNFLAGLPKDQSFHFDVILKNGVHCTPLQIHSDGKTARMFFVDAAGDPMNQRAKEDIENALGIVAHENLKIGTQKDGSSCSIYSMQDLNSMSKLTEDQLTTSFSPQKLENDQQLSKLHPKFIKNSQTMELIDKYKKLTPDSTPMLSQHKTLDKYIKDYSITVEIADGATGETKLKLKNYAIIAKRYKYLKSALETFNEAYGAGDEAGEQKIYKILQNRQGINILEGARSGLTDEQKIEINEVYNAKQIALVLNYGVGAEKLPCFDNGVMTDRAISFITDGIDQENINEDEFEIMGKRLDKIKDLESVAQLSAVLDYNLSPKAVNNAKCFQVDGSMAKYYTKHDRERDNEALERIAKAYNNPLPNQLAAQEIFNQIKQFSSKQDMILLLDYGLDSSSIKDVDSKVEILKRIEAIYNETSLNENAKKEAATNLFNQIKGLNNKEKMVAVLDYGLTVKEVNNTKLFDHEALKYVKKAFDNEGTLEEKQKFARDALDKIKDIPYSNQLYLVNNGIDPILAKSADFLASSYSGKMHQEAKKFVAKWYTMAGEKGSNAAFKTLNQIKYQGNFQLEEVQYLPKTAYQLHRHFATTNPELAEEWKAIFIKSKVEKTLISNKIITMMKSASGWIYDDTKTWEDIEKIVKALPEDERIEIINLALKKIDNTSRRDRLVSFLPKNEQNIVRNNVEPTAVEYIRETLMLMHGNSSVDVPTREYEGLLTKLYQNKKGENSRH